MRELQRTCDPDRHSMSTPGGTSPAFRRVIGERPPEERRYVIHVSATQPNYSGRRLWLHCASPSCQRRSGRLFLDDPYFVCRRCARVRYLSQTHPRPRHVQRVERSKAIRTELGGSRGRVRVVGGKTARRKVAEIEDLEMAEIERLLG